MEKLSAILFIPDDGVQNRLKHPLIFSPILFRPIIARLGEELAGVGVEDVCVICDGAYEKMSCEYLPETFYITFVDINDENAVDNILGFLGTHENTRTLVFTRPTLLLKGGAEKLAGIKNDVKFPVVYGMGAESGTYVTNSNLLKDAFLKADNFGAALARAGGAYHTSEGGVLPINGLAALHNIQDSFRMEIINEHIQNGVFIIDRSHCYIDNSVKIMPGATILPGTIIKGDSIIGEDCVIGPGSIIDNCTIGDRTKVNASQLTDSVIGSDTSVGPFAYVRPGCAVGNNVKVGDFVELKKADVGDGTKISHLTYIGDAKLGRGVNVGCGAVTVNYDGEKKARTIIEDDAFIGCNTNLIAPVKVGKGAYTAAGSTITQDVPECSLAIARTRQTAKAGWVKKNR